jgi:hypothetical protein
VRAFSLALLLFGRRGVVAAVDLREGHVFAIGAIGGGARVFLVHELLRRGYIIHVGAYNSNALAVSSYRKTYFGGAKQ